MIIQKKEMVRPSCFIYGRRLLSKLSNDRPDNFTVKNLARRIKHLHTVTQYYWNHLKMEYLNELCEY